MAKVNQFFLSFGIAALMLFSSCAIQPLTVSKVEKIRLDNISRGAIVIGITLQIKNPNGLKFKVKDNKLDITLNGIEMGTATVKDKIIIKKHSNDSHSFLIEAQFSKMALGLLPGLIGIARSKSVDVKIKGNATVKSFGISKSFPIEIVEKVDLKGLTNL